MDVNATATRQITPDSLVARAYEPREVETGTESSTPAREATRNTEKEQQQQLSEKEVAATVDSLNRNMDKLQTRLGFTVDNDAEEVIVSVINRETEEVIRQIPSEEILSLRERMEELTGLLLSEKV